MAVTSSAASESPLLYCPICDEGLNDHVSLAHHCDDRHSDVGANGKPQDYAVFTLTFGSDRQFEARLRSRINKDLHDLLSINDLSTFEGKFAQILAYLEVEGQGAMPQYLKDNYLGRTRSCASFANHGVLDTTMISERWHLRLKQDFLQQNANSRADFLVDLLIRAVEDIADTAEIRELENSVNMTEATSSNPVTEAQERRDQRSQIRNNIKSKFSVITANVNSLVNTNTEQALSFLKDIYELVDQASMIKLHPVSENLDSEFISVIYITPVTLFSPVVDPIPSELAM
ncbi:unnamed protein product [Cylicocyclus nassatus]|uniref:Uncharacterized protein n=1 Tax=Cylicocyclus nassatus TaxID=53992 RepID=A0AA36H895_CYLNA|nr:unnamed protein product [Cylicocyclus nassatus]